MLSAGKCEKFTNLDTQSQILSHVFSSFAYGNFALERIIVDEVCSTPSLFSNEYYTKINRAFASRSLKKDQPVFQYS